MSKAENPQWDSHRELHHGFEDQLIPLKPLDPSKSKNFSELAYQMSETAFGGRTVGEAIGILTEMSRDKDTFVVMSISGAMTVGKMGLLICELIDRKMVNALVVTGALMTHGLVETVGMTHFKIPSGVNDEEMYLKGYDRVYDTLELEQNLDDIEEIIFEVLDGIPKNKVLSSRVINEHIGKYLSKTTKDKGILKSAYKAGVPVYVPAFTDSELGLDVGLYNRRLIAQEKSPRIYNPFFDLEHYTHLIERQKKLGIFTIGGGVPRNWAQQVGPYIDLINRRGPNPKKDTPPTRFTYAVRVCPEPAHWGGLSGCTYSEGVSWGKFVPESQGGKHAEVLSDATIAWPFMQKALMERVGRKRLKKDIFIGKRAIKEIEKAVEKMYKF